MILSVALTCAMLAGEASATPGQRVVIVVGHAGDEEFGKMFRSWAERWQMSATSGGNQCDVVGLAGSGDGDKAALRGILAELKTESGRPLWLVLIGHGTFDGKQAKFNLRGPDLSAQELNEWLTPLEQPVAVINCASASGAFVNHLSAPNRVIVTATKSGFQYNFARFGQYISEAIANPAADLDKDEQVSLLEAFISAAGQVAEFYASDARLATEHALLDDNGDKLGTDATWFRGVRATKAAKAGAAVDGLRANQFHLLRTPQENQMSDQARQQRDRLEAQLEALRTEKTSSDPQTYYQRLEELLVQLALLYEREAAGRGMPVQEQPPSPLG